MSNSAGGNKVVTLRESRAVSKLTSVLFWLVPVLYVLIAIFLMHSVLTSGRYPSGSDVTYHFRRGDLVYQALSSGNLWPSYDPFWYNGVEILRYWPPLAAYVMGITEWIRGGDIFAGYILFVGVLYVCDAMSWFVIGRKVGRKWLGAFLGAMWFFFPVNMFVLFGEGNLPRALSTVFTPFLMYHVVEYLRSKEWKHLPWISVDMALIVLCHLGYGGMIALGVLLFLLIHKMVNVRTKGGLDIIVAMVIGFMLVGIWLVPSLVGGISNVDSSETMAGFFQSLRITLNPIRPYRQGLIVSYFGLVSFLTAALGALFSNRKCAPAFLTGMMICIFSSTVFYPMFAKMPGGQYMWMMRFFSFGLTAITVGFLYWKQLKKPFVVLLCALLVLDCLPSYFLAEGNQDQVTPEERYTATLTDTHLDRAKALTKQRLLVFNEGGGGLIDAYLISDFGGRTPSTFGAGWEAANTAQNITQLNRAAQDAYYGYMFDRALDLGNDTVMVRLPVIQAYEYMPEQVTASVDAMAARCGYELKDTTTGIRIYHLKNAPEHWGTVTKYRAIAIGTGSYRIALEFPAFREVSKTNLNEFTYEELKDYEVIYLDGFTYDDQEKAEELILRLSEHGVRIVILADGIPENHSSHNRNFLGVSCTDIMFKNGYPTLSTVNGELETRLFPDDLKEWQTVTLNGLSKVYGSVEDNGLELPFFGTGKNENLIYIGLDLTKFYGVTLDEQVGKLLSAAMDLDSEELPERRVVALSVETTAHGITIESPEDGVNTAIAYHDMFRSDRKLESSNNLLYVNKGKTVIRFVYPYLWQGILVNALGVLLLILFAIYKKKLGEGLAKGNFDTDVSAG